MKKAILIIIILCGIIIGNLMFITSSIKSMHSDTDTSNVSIEKSEKDKKAEQISESEVVNRPVSDISSESENKSETDSKAESDNKTEAENNTEKENKTESYLLIGSSYYYYNNVPEMLYNFAKKGTGNNVEMSSCSLNGQTLIEHARAIKAVIRTAGDINKLTDKEKKYFVAEKSGGGTEYAEYVYERYADVFWDYENNCAKQFSYVIMAPIHLKKYGDGPAETMEKSISSIIGDIGTKDTRFVLQYTQETMKGSLTEAIKDQAKIDNLYDKTVELLKSDNTISEKYKSIDSARTGKAYCNYLMYYGDDKAIKSEEEAYKIYDNKLSRHGFKNDIYLGEGEHVTVLGSYMMAASIYVTLFGDSDNCLSAFDISEKYRGETIGECANLRAKKAYKTNYGLCYNKGAGFKSKDICRAATFIVEQTQLNSMNLTVKMDVNNWKENPENINYVY